MQTEIGTLHSEAIISDTDKKFGTNGINPTSKFNKNVSKINQEYVWKNIIIMTILHAIALQALWYLITGNVKWQTFLFNYIYVSFSTTGVTGGAHRLWAHRTYKAKLPFRIWLMLGQTAALQNDIYTWVRDHRAHHKFTDSDADPHNSSRGFFFCHIGWLLRKKHPDVITKGKTIDLSDVESDPVVIFQRKYYIPLILFMTFILPTYIPIYFWSEGNYISFSFNIFRYVISLNGTWLVNSAAHMWGYKPYDQTINPVENRFVSTIGFGEGWHNYHHTFPWDYKAAELGDYSMNYTTALLDFAAYIGQVYDLKTVSEEMVKKRANRTGDGSWQNDKKSVTAGGIGVKTDQNFHETCVWGWGDKDMKEEEIKGVTISYTKQKLSL